MSKRHTVIGPKGRVQRKASDSPSPLEEMNTPVSGVERTTIVRQNFENSKPLIRRGRSVITSQGPLIDVPINVSMEIDRLSKTAIPEVHPLFVDKMAEDPDTD